MGRLARRELVALAGALALAGCAGPRVDLGAGGWPPLARVEAAAPVRLAVPPIQDGRERRDREGGGGPFLQAVGDDRFGPDVPAVVTALLRRRLAEAGFHVEPAPPADPASPAPAEPAGLVLRGRLATLSGQREAQLSSLVSVATLPLALPLAIFGATLSVPTPAGILAPVTYAGQAVLEIELVEPASQAVIWQREVEGIARRKVAGWDDLVVDHGGRMAEVARQALGKAVAELVSTMALEVGRPVTAARPAGGAPGPAR
jgi:hypothetical protein